MPTPNPVRHVFHCDCETEGLLFEYDPEYNDVHIAMWHHGGYSHKLDWKARLRWCWHIIRKGLPWADAVSMKPTEARRFAQTILATIKDEG